MTGPDRGGGPQKRKGRPGMGGPSAKTKQQSPSHSTAPARRQARPSAAAIRAAMALLAPWRPRMSGGLHHVRLRRGEVADVITRLHHAAPHVVPLLRAVAAGVHVACVPRGVPFPRELAALEKPCIVVIGDDDGLATGPAGYPAAKRLGYWARRAMVHGAGGEAEHYELAVEAAALYGRVLIVETGSARISEWRRCLGDGRRVPLLVIVPRYGVHPVAPPRETRQ